MTRLFLATITVLSGVAVAAQAKDDQAMGRWLISDRGVGKVVLGRALPRSLRTGDLAERYFVRYFADGQPEEGFRYDDPPLLVVLASGPFQRAAAKEVVQPDAARYRAAALQAVRAGARVRAVRVVGEGPKTAAGVGVGSTLADLRAAYPDLETHANPPTLGQDECAALSPSLPHVVFLFETCDGAASGARVLRVDVW